MAKATVRFSNLCMEPWVTHAGTRGGEVGHSARGTSPDGGETQENALPYAVDEPFGSFLAGGFREKSGESLKEPHGQGEGGKEGSA